MGTTTNSERVAGGDAGPMPRCPARSSVVASRGRGNINARRSPWIALPSSADDWPVPRAAAPRPNSSSRCAVTTTRAVPVTTSVTGSRLILPRRLHSAASWPLSWPAVTPMPPDNVKGRPPVASQASGPDAKSATITAASIARDAGARPASARRRARRPIANTSLYYPVPGRGLYWLPIRCPYCRGTHLGRVREEIKAGGNRRVSCGPVQVVVRRVYRPAVGKAAA